MKLVRFLWRTTLSFLSTVLIAVLLLGLFFVYRISGPEQLDDNFRISQKQTYLESLAPTAEDIAPRPNIILILYDDLGYGDIGVGASGLIKTPNIDQLAAQGISLTDFHSPAPVCTPSRAGFLTGRLAPRAGLFNVVFPSGSTEELFFSRLPNPDNNTRLPADEITLAEVLKAAGYTTGMVGKWHLGDRSPSLPNDLGFDSYYGALYSNDMEPFAFYRNREISVQAPVDQRKMSELYTREATSFIESNADQPFFLYFAHNFPHRPLFVRQERSGQSAGGLYGDVLEELDDGIGHIVASLEETGNLDNTLLIITSDNGPWYIGDAGDHRGRKGNTFEGGMRVPFIAHWPEQMSGGRTEAAMAMGIDLLPTVLEILQLPQPTDRILDGTSIRDVLLNGGPTPHDYLYYYDGDVLFAVRDQRFKYRGPAGVMFFTDQMPIGITAPQAEWLFDLEVDPRESYNASDRYPQELARLRRAFQAKVAEMEGNQRGWN